MMKCASLFGLLPESPISPRIWLVLVGVYILYVTFCLGLILFKSNIEPVALIISMLAGGMMLGCLRSGYVAGWGNRTEHSRQPFLFWVGIVVQFSFLVFTLIVGIGH